MPLHGRRDENTTLVTKFVMIMKMSFISKCFSCLNPNCEYVDHLFIKSDIDAGLWEYFGKIIGKKVRANSFFNFLNL